MNISRRPLLLGAAASALFAGAAHAQGDGFAGDWHGALSIGAQRLRLRLNVVTAGPSATLYSLDQGGGAIPASETRIEGDRIDVRFAAIGARFDGRLAGGQITGTFTQGPGSLPLTLGREPIAPPAAPPVEALTQARLAALRTAVGAPAMAAAASKLGVRNVAFADGLRAVGQPQTVTTTDKWHLGSITKSMTSTLVARLVEQGVVSWDDTLGDVLGASVPQMRDEYRRVTYRHLLSHRSGLPANIPGTSLMRYQRYNDDPREERVAYAREALAQTPEGAAEQNFTYSNSGYIIAGAMLEARTQTKWETLINEHVFAPLHMTGAGQGAPGTAGAFDQPVGHTAGAGGALTAFPVGGQITDNPAVLGPAGRAHAELEGVLKYLAAHCTRNGFLSPESWTTLHTPPFGGDYAMGWVKRGDALWHNGSNTLWYAEVSFNPTTGIVAAAATNDGRVGQIGPTLSTVLQSAIMAVA